MPNQPKDSKPWKTNNSLPGDPGGWGPLDWLSEWLSVYGIRVSWTAEEKEAYDRIVATCEAAPELLEACKNTVEELDGLWNDYQNGRDIDVSHLVASMLQPLRAAITKAGEIK